MALHETCSLFFFFKIRRSSNQEIESTIAVIADALSTVFRSDAEDTAEPRPDFVVLTADCTVGCGPERRWKANCRNYLIQLSNHFATYSVITRHNFTDVFLNSAKFPRAEFQLFD